MEMQPVVSSNISALGYDPATRTLRIEFKPSRTGKGPQYDYFDVEPATVDEMVKAESMGSFFRANIMGVHKFERVEEDE
jgi:hypothetical protein